MVSAPKSYPLNNDDMAQQIKFVNIRVVFYLMFSNTVTYLINSDTRRIPNFSLVLVYEIISEYLNSFL